jgi:hypothetical protein
VKQPRNPWSDGPENITQCPIQQGKNFTQEVIFSTEEGTGHAPQSMAPLLFHLKTEPNIHMTHSLMKK